MKDSRSEAVVVAEVLDVGEVTKLLWALMADQRREPWVSNTLPEAGQRLLAHDKALRGTRAIFQDLYHRTEAALATAREELRRHVDFGADS